MPGAHVLRADGTRIVAGALDGTVLVADVDGLADIMDTGDAVLDAVTVRHPDGPAEFLAVATPLAIRVIDLTSGDVVTSLPPGDGQPTRLAALRSLPGIAWGDEGGGISVWRLAGTGAMAGTVPVRWPRHRKAVHQLQALCLGDTEYLASGADDRYVYLTDARTGAVTATCHPHVDWLAGVVALSTPDGRGHALTIDRRRVATWDFDETGAVTAVTATDQDGATAWDAWWSQALATPVYAVATEDGVLRLSAGQGAVGRVLLANPALALAPGPGGASVMVAEADGTLSEVASLPDRNWRRTARDRFPGPILRLRQVPGWNGHVTLDASGSIALISQEGQHA